MQRPGRIDAGNMPVRVRRYAERDFDALVRRWHETNVESYWYVREHQRHTLDDAIRFFREHVVARCEIWIAHDSDESLGLLALEAPWIRQFAVFREFHRRGVGTALLSKARARSADELRLHTFQRNLRARAFYEKHGFTAVAFGLSPAPELEPDVEYRWMPTAHRESFMHVRGRCHCGRVSYEADVDPAEVSACHCTDCQMLCGSAYRVSVRAPSSTFRLLSGQPRTYIKTADSGAKRVHAFCGDCGTPTYACAPDNPPTYSLRVGCLDEREALGPRKQIWCRSSVPWSQDLTGVPKFDRQ